MGTDALLLHLGEGRRKGKGRDQDDAFANQGTPKLGRKPPEAGEKHGKVSLTATRRNNPALILDLQGPQL